jgi:hypothetical protein
MRIHTDVACLYCGHISWHVELEHTQPWQTAMVLWPEGGSRLPARPSCTRCGGPVYLDSDYRVVRVNEGQRRPARSNSVVAASQRVPSIVDPVPDRRAVAHVA